MCKIIIFMVATIIFVYVSRKSLSNIRSHGFYRFFAWESILVLVLMNVEFWFEKPFHPMQLLSWIFLFISIVLVVLGAVTLYKKGKPDKKRDDNSLYGIEKTTELVSTGIYRYLRHPIYAAGIYGAWGVFFKRPSLIAAGLTVLTCVLFTLTAKMEEVENIKYFGAAYQDYIKCTRMFIPFLF
ncbi:MAG: isoprenylcysteine carboxylmethyltransferase family protein [FCB group bacterium]|nr:isoprenylcysteine carboxylmethyltransferase family protein [FCB group bacterium]